MIETISKLLQDPKTKILSFLLGMITGGALVWFTTSELNNRRVLALEAEKNQLASQINRLSTQLESAPHAVQPKAKRDCHKIEKLIERKNLDALKKEEEVHMAAPFTMSKKRTDPNSLYKRRLRELRVIQEHVNKLNNNLIECISD